MDDLKGLQQIIGMGKRNNREEEDGGKFDKSVKNIGKKRDDK